MLAYIEYEDGLCGGCGHSRSKAWSEDAEDEYLAYNAVCRACAALEVGREAKGLPRGTQLGVNLHPEWSGGFDDWSGKWTPMRGQMDAAPARE